MNLTNKTLFIGFLRFNLPVNGPIIVIDGSIMGAFKKEGELVFSSPGFR
jgi:hypothetical protein